MQDREAIKNKILACFKEIDEQYESSTTKIENSIEQMPEFQQSDQGLDNTPKLQQQSQPQPTQPNVSCITNELSKLSGDIVEALKFKQ
ncbi:unnamed protein product (macronuclear) [Paramecium tetraurelia]|uniref:Uncharacterized protein n=1 Tax=Paramecium tetraurelia TaxID=5888 RepID=A0E4A5_PARTE|nr:uncharacterized protein GSPATT00023296001 [Paramecium tetraurelia]CAK90122.1 unnamed protein product [Paramecium tetraurelia]|eukprot:XP_001457519.1 hypothetical protein (macronuclear) [Paramecium tetraurelia strain d4-2]